MVFGEARSSCQEARKAPSEHSLPLCILLRHWLLIPTARWPLVPGVGAELPSRPAGQPSGHAPAALKKVTQMFRVSVSIAPGV